MPKFNYEQFLKDWVKFNPNIEISFKDNIPPQKTTDLVICHCKLCGGTFEQSPKYLRLAIRRKPEAKGCKICLNKGIKKSKETIYTLEKINEILKENNPQVTALKELPEHKLLCHCSKCGQDFIQWKYETKDSKSCPVCYRKIIIPGVNDLKTTHPQIASYYISEEFITSHSIGSHKKEAAKCPKCGTIKMIEPYAIKQRGFCCQACSDGISYPNKFIREVINQLPVSNIIHEYSPKWISPKRYDVYFEFNNNKYIIEMDGFFHYNDGFREKVEETQKRDEIKTKEAQLHNIKIIRIKALESNQEYLKTQILNSELSNIMDLSSINWDKCDQIATSNLLTKVCEMYTTSTKTKKEIGKELNISEATVSNYLLKGNKLKICNYEPQEGRLRSREYTIYVLDKNKKLLFIASCLKEAFYQLNKLYPDINFVYSTGTRHVRKTKKYLGFYFLTKDNYNRKEGDISNEY